MPANDKRFSFVSLGMPGDTFGVVRFKGQEALSTLYQFEIELVAWDPELDMNEVIQNPAYLTILRNHGDISFNGMLSEFEQKHKVGSTCFYRAVLVPRVWWLSQSQNNQVFIDESIEDILGDILSSADFAADRDFEIDLEKEHPKMDYVCQYGESLLSFMERLMEREGIYYYFKQTDGREKMIITDTRMDHDFHPLRSFAYYLPPGTQDYNSSFEAVRNFSCRQKMIPKTVRLKTYNWEHPGMDLECSAEVFEEGRGEVYIYGDNFKTEQEGNRLAAIRAEEILCWKESYFGDSNAPFLQPGYNFSLLKHFRNSYDQKYMTVEVSHEGNQSAHMLAGISQEFAGREQEPTYSNSFTAIPAGIQFRPCRKTEKPRFYGSLNAKIDAAGDGTYAELNENGCYKVKMPFDRADYKVDGKEVGGKASAWIRMMQPYAGSNYGIHFPLHKGAEVLLTFIDGDPDRPVISGAVPNPENAGVVDEDNQTQCDIKTGGGNEIKFEDRKGHKQVQICCPHEETMLKLGYPTDNKAWYQRMGLDGFGTIGTLISLAGPAGWIKAGCNLAGVAFGGHDLGVEDGIEMKTGNGLKVAARKKEECIGSFTGPGYSQASVVGLNTLAVKGFSEKSIIGWCDEKTLGNHTFTAVGNYTTTEAGHTQKLETIAEHISGKVSKVLGDESKLAGKVSDIVVSATDMAGKGAKYVGDEVIGKGKESAVNGAKSAWTGISNKLRGKKSEVNGQDSELVGEEMQIIGKSNSMSGSSTTLNGDETSISGKSTSLDGNKTEMSTANTELAATKNII